MAIKYVVTLTPEERQQLTDLIAAGKAAAHKLAHARILLKADAAPGGPAWTDDRIAEAVEVSAATVERVRQRFVERGARGRPAAPQAQGRTGRGSSTARAEARLIALACSAPPEGRARWTLQLLADKLVELEVVDAICPTRRCGGTLKKTSSSRG